MGYGTPSDALVKKMLNSKQIIEEKLKFSLYLSLLLFLSTGREAFI